MVTLLAAVATETLLALQQNLNIKFLSYRFLSDFIDWLLTSTKSDVKPSLGFYHILTSETQALPLDQETILESRANLFSSVLLTV